MCVTDRVRAAAGACDWPVAGAEQGTTGGETCSTVLLYKLVIRVPTVTFTVV